MKRGFSVLSVLVLVAVGAIAAASAQAQHLHAHGNHVDVHQNVPHGHDAAGHLVDRMGHHIDGHGRHTGALGVYENGSYSLPYSHHRSGYYPSYSSYPYSSYPYSSSPYYSRYSNSLYLNSLYSNSLNGSSLYGNSLYGNSLYGSPLYSSPPYSAPLYSAPQALPRVPAVNAAPLAAANAARNRIPLPGPAVQGGAFVLTNPRDSGGPIRYSLNSFDYTINPGETQTVPLDRDWVITFDNGLNKTVTYRMEDGVYDFSVSPQQGWDLVKRAPAVLPANGPNALPTRRSL